MQEGEDECIQDFEGNDRRLGGVYRKWHDNVKVVLWPGISDTGYGEV
jgi:hypothetical protein